MIPALWFLARRSQPRMLKAAWEAQDRTAALAGVVDSSVAGIRVVKGFGQERQELARLTAAARRLFSGRLRVLRLTARYEPVLQAIPALAQVAVLALGGWMALRGELSLGTFVAFSAYLAQLVVPLSMLVGLLSAVQQGAAAINRVLDLVTARPTLTQGRERLPAQSPSKSSSTASPSATTPTAPSSTTSPCGSPPARRSPSSAVPARANRPCSTCWPGTTTPPGARCGSAEPTSASSPSTPCAAPWGRSPRRPSCSPRASATTSRSAVRTRATPRSAPPPASRRPTRSSRPSRTATTHRWGSAASPSPVASGSASHSPAHCSPSPGCWCWTMRPPPSTPMSRPPSTTGCAP